MAKITRSKRITKAKKTFKKTRKEKSKRITLPTKPSAVDITIAACSILMHGSMKIGKTSFFSHEEDALFIELDPYQKALAARIMQVHIDKWVEFQDIINQLTEMGGDIPYRTVIVDRVDLLHPLLLDYMTEEEWGGVSIAETPDRETAGKWTALRTAFTRAITQLMSIPCGIRFICHSKMREVDTMDAGKQKMMSPDMSGQPSSVVTGQADITCCYNHNGDERIITLLGDDDMVAGHRLEDNFRTPDGRAVREIPMGGSCTEAYANFDIAFRNEQPFTTIDERDGVKPRKKRKGFKTKKKSKKKLPKKKLKRKKR